MEEVDVAEVVEVDEDLVVGKHHPALSHLPRFQIPPAPSHLHRRRPPAAPLTHPDRELAIHAVLLYCTCKQLENCDLPFFFSPCRVAADFRSARPSLLDTQELNLYVQ